MDRQQTKVIKDVGKHPCIVCKGNMHGFICSDMKTECMQTMTCLKCAEEANKSSGGGGDVGNKEQNNDEGSTDDNELIVLDEATTATG